MFATVTLLEKWAFALEEKNMPDEVKEMTEEMADVLAEEMSEETAEIVAKMSEEDKIDIRTREKWRREALSMNYMYWEELKEAIAKIEDNEEKYDKMLTVMELMDMERTLLRNDVKNCQRKLAFAIHSEQKLQKIMYEQQQQLKSKQQE